MPCARDTRLERRVELARVAQDAQFRGRLLNDVLARVGGAKHQRELAVDGTHDRVPCEQKARSRAREARKHESGYEREHHETDEDLGHCHHMAVQGLRVHIPVAHGCQSFDAEEESAEEAGRIEVRDASRHEVIEAAEQEIEDQKERGNRAENLRPAHGHEVVEQILQHRRRDSLRDHLALPEPDAAESNGFVRRSARAGVRRLLGSL